MHDGFIWTVPKSIDDVWVHIERIKDTDMDKGFDYAHHLFTAIHHLHVAEANAATDPERARSELVAARASVTRALIMLPKPGPEDDAA